MFLTDRQVRRLTGELNKTAQISWLESNRIRHWINAAGKPIVPCSEIATPGAMPLAAGGWTPDFSKVA